MTKNSIEVGPVTDEKEARTVIDIVSHALFFTHFDLNQWVEREGLENFRAARRNGQTIGGYTVQRMGHWFGGRSIPTGGIRAVGVAAEHRSGGVGAEMMRSAIRELHRDNIPLATLYPATQTVYRRAGFEVAGVRMAYKMATRDIDARGPMLPIRPALDADHAAMREVYQRVARVTSGNLDRSDWMWHRILNPPPWMPSVSVNLVEREGVCEGYIVVGHKIGATPLDVRLDINDVAVTSGDALRRLLGFVADHRSVARDVRWVGGPANGSELVLTEQLFTHDERMDWMLRIVDVVAALEQRGYPKGLTAELHLEVRDDVIAENNRKFLVEIADGRAIVREGGRGGLSVHIRGLASLYSGMFSPQPLCNAGLLQGSDEDFSIASAVFAGPTPWMVDFF